MKLLTREQEQAHYDATLKGGFLGGTAGLAFGTVGVLAASRRYQFFRQLTLPLKAFLITSSGTFAGIISADHGSRTYEREHNPIDQEYDARQKEKAIAAKAGKSFTERAMDFGKKERYKIVAASWVASMFAAFTIVNRNKYLSGQQKLVQARVYAQFLTVGVLVATAAFEISDRNNDTGRYETIKVIDPDDPKHQRMIQKQRYVDSNDTGDELWKDMVAAEEQRMKDKDENEKHVRAETAKKHKKESKDGKKSDDKENKKGDEKESKKSDDKDDKKGDDKDGKKSEDKDKGPKKPEEKSPAGDKDAKKVSADSARNSDEDKSSTQEKKKSKKDE